MTFRPLAGLSRRLATLAVAPAFGVTAALGCASESAQPDGQLMLVLDGDLSLPDDIDSVQLRIRSSDDEVHNAEYPLGRQFAFPSTIGIRTSVDARREVEIRVLGKRGGPSGVIRIVRDVRSEVPRGRVAALPINLTKKCLDAIQTPAVGGEVGSACGAERTCVWGSCAGVALPERRLPTYQAETTYRGFDSGVDLDVVGGKSRTRERGAPVVVRVHLLALPTSAVSIPFASSDETEAKVSPNALVFSGDDALSEKSVTVTPVDDAARDGEVDYRIIVGPVVSDDEGYKGIDPPDLAFANEDDD